LGNIQKTSPLYVLVASASQMAPKRKAAAVTKAKASASTVKKVKATKVEKTPDAAPAAAGSSDGKNISLIIEAW
jgi:hypothetical protein